MDAQHHAVWQEQQTELWDRIFKLIQDITLVASSMKGSMGEDIMKQAMVRSAMDIGLELVRANAAEQDSFFINHIQTAKVKLVETDYWIRLTYALQEGEKIQNDLSGIITQCDAIMNSLQSFLHHLRSETDIVRYHTVGKRQS